MKNFFMVHLSLEKDGIEGCRQPVEDKIVIVEADTLRSSLVHHGPLNSSVSEGYRREAVESRRLPLNKRRRIRIPPKTVKPWAGEIIGGYSS